ncbi:MAG TPA: TolC family protein [Sedimentisphaerales bacterium]|nr:TolC family protein [Sedimentisphaerales bacterium]
MFCKFRPITFLYGGLGIAVIFCIAGGCSPEHYKAEADKEVYKIIDGKWQDGFGQKVNYTVSDVPPSANDVQIKKTVPSSNVISLAHAVAMATAHNRDYQLEKESLYLSALGLTGTRHQYARQWFGTIDYRYTREEGEENVRVGGKPGEGSEKLVGFGHTQLLGDGLLVTTNLAINWARYLAGDPRTSLGSVLIATVTAPILGAGAGKEARELLTLAERKVLYDIRTFNRYRKTFVVGIVTAYYNVLQLRDVVTNAENNYKRSVESKERLEMESEAGRKSRIDVDEAEQNVLAAESRVVAAQERYEQSLDAFKMSLSLPTDANVVLDQNELKALEEMGISEIDFTLDEAIETALLQRLDLYNSADSIDDALRNVLLAAEGLGPQLNLTGSAGVESPEGTNFDRLQFHRGNYDLGFEADLPFDRKTQRNNYRMALIALEQQQRKYEEDMDSIKLAVRGAYRRLKETADRYKIEKNSLKLAEERVEMNKVLLDAGRVTTRILLLSQDSLLAAQNNVTGALIDHLNAKLSFYRDVGIMQVRPDGMWE